MRSLRFARATAIAATTIGLVFTGTTMANADDSGARVVPQASKIAKADTAHGRISASRPVDVRWLKGSRAVVGYSTATVRTAAGITKAAWVRSFFLSSADVYRGSRKVGVVQYPLNSSSSTGSFSFHSSWGRGKFTLRHLHIATYFDSPPYGTKYVDGTVGTFSAKSAIGGGLKYNQVIHMTRRGSKHHVKVGLKYFSTSGHYKGFKTKAKVQYKKHGHWKTLKKVKTHKKGKKSLTFYTHSTRKWRLKWKGSAYVIGGHSSSFKL